jgi:pyruvate,orthophosphate dikinase
MNMVTNTVPDHVVLGLLHRLRIGGRVVANDLPADEATLGILAAHGLLRCSENGCTLTGPGLRRHAELIAAERESIDLVEVDRSYARFLQVNQPVKDTCASWQASGGQGDENAAIRALDVLEGLFDRARPALERVSSVVPRFGSYPQRLEAALDSVAAGDHAYLVAPQVDSFHTVWFECHEDYLLTLGRDREQEESEHDAR